MICVAAIKTRSATFLGCPTKNAAASKAKSCLLDNKAASNKSTALSMLRWNCHACADRVSQFGLKDTTLSRFKDERNSTSGISAMDFHRGTTLRRFCE